MAIKKVKLTFSLVLLSLLFAFSVADVINNKEDADTFLNSDGELAIRLPSQKPAQDDTVAESTVSYEPVKDDLDTVGTEEATVASDSQNDVSEDTDGTVIFPKRDYVRFRPMNHRFRQFPLGFSHRRPCNHFRHRMFPGFRHRFHPRFNHRDNMFSDGEMTSDDNVESFDPERFHGGEKMMNVEMFRRGEMDVPPRSRWMWFRHHHRHHHHHHGDFVPRHFEPETEEKEEGESENENDSGVMRRFRKFFHF